MKRPGKEFNGCESVFLQCIRVYGMYIQQSERLSDDWALNEKMNWSIHGVDNVDLVADE